MPRPKGSVNRSAKFENYSPRRWHPEFDLIVIGSVSGKSNEELAQTFGYTKQHVSNILSTRQAADLKEKIRSEIGRQFDDKLQDKVAAIGGKAIETIEKFINDESHYQRSPFNFVDRAIKIAQLSNGLSSESNPSNGNNSSGTHIHGNAIIVNGDKGKDLLDALEKSRDLDKVVIADSPKMIKSA